MATDRELEAMTTEDVITYIKTGRADAYDRWANGGEHRNLHVAWSEMSRGEQATRLLAGDEWGSPFMHDRSGDPDYSEREDDQRDYAEKAYNAAFCPACGTSPCESEDGHESERIAEMYEDAGDK